MKKLVLLIMLAMQAFFATSSFANTKTYVHNNDLVDELFIRNYAEQELHITPQQFNALTPQQRAGIFSRLFKWLGLGGLISGYGQYEEPGMRTERGHIWFFSILISLIVDSKIMIIR